MSPDTLRVLMNARPFVPFALQVADGRNYEVPRPDFIAVSRSGRTAEHSTEEYNGEGTVFLYVFQLLSIAIRDKDTANPTPPAGDGNGSNPTPPSAPE